jgi:hypothetical protein
MRNPRSFPAALLLAASCFTPSDDASPDAQTDGSGPGTDEASDGASDASSGPESDASSGAPGTGDEAPTSSEAGDTTGEGDTPPAITSFTLDGSEAPGAVASGGMMTLAAEAVDDEGIDRIEFLDGDTTLAVVEAPPYEASVLVTSSDNGAHAYRAIAYDTAEQSDDASLDVNVSITGGSIVQLREDVLGLCIYGNFASGGPQGRGTAVVEGEEVALEPGVLLLVEAGERHEVRDSEDVELRTLNVYAAPAY